MVIPFYNVELIDQQIENFYREINFRSRVDALVKLSERFLNYPYGSGPCGEGSAGDFDQNPVYRFDIFDCVTYVNSVLALCFANDLGEFKKNIAAINYQGSNVRYFNRLHFTCVDWNPVVEKLQIAKNITEEFYNKKNEAQYKIADALIDKPSWYRFKKITDIKLLSHNVISAEENLLEDLQDHAKHTSAVQSRLAYLPLDKIFKPSGEVEESLLRQIPDYTIIEIVRPNWNLREKIGTNLNISHLGFGLRLGQELYFRHASSEFKKVVQVKLVEYLRECQKIPSIGGIHVLGLALKS